VALSYHITPLEVALYVWFAAFAYDELGEFIDAGSIFYAVDIWSAYDILIHLANSTRAEAFEKFLETSC
jgi:hypothetical protein